MITFWTLIILGLLFSNFYLLWLVYGKDLVRTLIVEKYLINSCAHLRYKYLDNPLLTKLIEITTHKT